MSLIARLKSLLCHFMLLGEFCHRCGVKQPLVWWCEKDELWREVTGRKEDGIYCPRCFDALAEKKGISLRWMARESFRFDRQRSADHAAR